MLASFRAEALKLRGLRLWMIVCAGGAIVPLLTALSIHAALKRLSTETLAEAPWQNGIIGDAVVTVDLVFPTLVVLVTALVFFVEHRNDAWKQLRTTGQNMATIYAAKFVAVQSLLLAGIVVASIAGAVAWLLLPIEMQRMFGAPSSAIYAFLRTLGGRMYIALLPVSAVQFALSARIRNVLYPVGIGLVLTFASLLLFGPATAPWLPYAYPGGVVIDQVEDARRTFAKQETDTNYQPPRDAFRSSAARGKVIVVDEGHGNRHGLGTTETPGTLRWIVAAAEDSGVTVRGLYGPARPEALSRASLLIAAGATSAFTDSEIASIVEWVRGGGSLLLLTDHPPFSGSTASLTAAFGVGTTLDVVVDPQMADPRMPQSARIRFAGDAIAAHDITKGVRCVVTYGGQVLWRAAPETAALLRLSPAARLADGRATRTGDAALAQLISFAFGRGRVVVSGETALFTSQRKSRGVPIGVGDRACDNERLAVNTMRWLLRFDR